MKANPKYKPSNIEWIGEIPEHWEVWKLKWVSNLIYGSSLSNDERIEGKVPVYGSNGIIGYHNQAISKKPCIIIGRKGSFGKINYSNIECFPIDTTYYIDETATKNNLLWLLYVLYTLNLDSLSKDSAVPGLSREDAYEKLILVPPLPEQRAIARCLDDRTRKIDSLIEKKQKLIELLKEERAAVINQAVTKGLDPSAPMRDSGVEWLGEVPGHWKGKKLKYLVTLVNEKSNSDSPEVRIALENIESYTGKLINLNSETIFEGEAKVFMRGDVLFNKLRPYLAKVFNSKTNGICVGELLVLRPSKSVISDFLYYRVLSEDFIKEVNSSTYGAKMPRASWEFIGNMLIPFPAIEEQREIIRFIESESTKTDHIISRIEKEIALLQKYRTALISEVVTGKIDVRAE